MIRFGQNALRHAAKSTAIASAFMLLVSMHAHAQFLQQGPKLVSPSAVGDARQGGSVASSGDGATIVVGGSFDDGEKGAAFVYERVGSSWSPAIKLTALDAVGTARQGWSVAIARDGNTIAVGGAHDSGHAGAVWIYARAIGGGWATPKKLVAPDATGTGATQGWSVALSANGSTMIVGAPFDGHTQPPTPDDQYHGSQNGAAWIWTLDGAGNWTSEKLPLPVDISPGSHFGAAVSLSADGGIALVGVPYDHDDAGAAVVYERDAVGHWVPMPKLAPSPAGSWLGTSVALAGDGQTVLVGAPFGDGAAWVYTRSGGSWSSPEQLIGTPSVPGSSFGQSVSIDGDGRTALVGAPMVNDFPSAGEAWLFGLHSSGTWKQLSGPLTGTGGTADASQGWMVGLSSDGQTAVSGGPNDNGGMGATWVFAQGTLCPSVFFESVGDLPGDCVYSLPTDISANGAYVSLSSAADEAYTTMDAGTCPSYIWPHSNEAAGWTRPCRHLQFFSPPSPGPGGLQALGYLPGTSAAHDESLAYGISSDGQVVVGFSNYDKHNNTKAVVFLPTLTRALDPPSGYPSAAAIDVSQHGAPAPNRFNGTPEVKSAMSHRVIVGYASTSLQEPIKGPGPDAAYWDSWMHCEVLPVPSTLPNGDPVMSSEALCISDDGRMIGGRLYYDKRANPSHHMSFAAVWKLDPSAPAGGPIYDLMAVLEDLPGGDDNARITHISGDGNVLVGYGSTGTANYMCWDEPRTACKWVLSSGPTPAWGTPIPLMPLDGAMFSIAQGTNQNGSVIVGTCLNISDPCDYPWFEDQAVIWADGGTSSAPQVIAQLLGSQVPSGWSLFEALRVSANGRIVTGYGFDPDFNLLGWVAGVP